MSLYILYASVTFFTDSLRDNLYGSLTFFTPVDLRAPLRSALRYKNASFVVFSEGVLGIILLRIFLTKQFALDDLKRHLSRNGYPRGIISYNMNNVVNKHRNKPKDIITVPEKEIFIVLPYLGVFKVKLSFKS